MTPTRRRIPDTGLIKPYRPCPADFAARYLEMGWSKELVEHYRTNWRCIRRWIEQAGGEDLRQARALLTGRKLQPKRRSNIFVLHAHCGGKRTRRKPWPCPAPKFWDVGLVRAECAERHAPRGPYKITIDRAVRLAMATIADGVSEEFRAGVVAAVAAIEAAKAAA